MVRSGRYSFMAAIDGVSCTDGQQAIQLAAASAPGSQRDAGETADVCSSCTRTDRDYCALR
jgi:hypothetical protein